MHKEPPVRLHSMTDNSTLGTNTCCYIADFIFTNTWTSAQSVTIFCTTIMCECVYVYVCVYVCVCACVCVSVLERV